MPADHDTIERLWRQLDTAYAAWHERRDERARAQANELAKAISASDPYAGNSTDVKFSAVNRYVHAHRNSA